MYANADPHLGFAMELVQADVIARLHRLNGEDVFFVTGMDEHGKKIFEAAKAAGVDTQQFVNEKSQKMQDLLKVLNISNNFFIRTADKENHWPTVEKVWGILKENGDIYEKEYEGKYCVGCEAFLLDRELVDGKCPIHLKELEIIKEKNYFFKLSKYLSDVKNILEKNEINIEPANRKLEALNMIDAGMGDISISRPASQVSWGIPVPGDPQVGGQNIYVWFEALLNYLSAVGFAEKDTLRQAQGKFEKYWPADLHFIGKDILKFHAIVWPAILLAADIKPPKAIWVHDFITVDGHKMSKSLGNVVSPFDIASKYGGDAFRYFFTVSISEKGFTAAEIDYTEEKFAAKYVADLSNGLGNLVSRILNIAKKNQDLLGDVFVESSEFLTGRRSFSPWEEITTMNRRIETEKLWELPKQEDKQDDFKKYITEHINNLALIAQRIQPWMPETSKKMFAMIGIKMSDKDRLIWDKQKIEIGEIKQLFPRVELNKAL